MAVIVNGSAAGHYLAPADLQTPAVGYKLALRASQASNGQMIDYSPARNTFPTNTALIPVTWTASAAVATNAYRTPTVLNGFIYKATTGGTNAATEPVWPTVVGNTVVSGTTTYTCEKGPHFADASGTRLFRSLSSAQTGAAATYQLADSSAFWNLATKDSFILNLRIKQDWAATSQGAASPIFSTRDPASANWAGMRILATGATFNNMRIQFRDGAGAHSVLSGDFAAGYGYKAFDGTERNVLIAVDGPSKTAFFAIDGVFPTQSNMYDANALCPNGLSLGTLTDSTAANAAPITIGGDSNTTTSFECAFKSIDYILLKGQSLPANLQAVANFFARGGEQLLPQKLVM